MTLASAASLIACLLFAAAMLHVVVTDLRHRRIRNWLVAGMAAAYLPLALASGLSGAQIAVGFAAAVLVFALGFGAFAAGWIGGGDVKLASVAALWLGAEQALPFLLLTSVLGAALAVALLAGGALRRLVSADAAAPVPAPTVPAPTGPAPRLAIPYGPALAVAGLMLLRRSPWVEAL